MQLHHVIGEAAQNICSEGRDGPASSPTDGAHVTAVRVRACRDADGAVLASSEYCFQAARATNSQSPGATGRCKSPGRCSYPKWRSPSLLFASLRDRVASGERWISQETSLLQKMTHPLDQLISLERRSVGLYTRLPSSELTVCSPLRSTAKAFLSTVLEGVFLFSPT